MVYRLYGRIDETLKKDKTYILSIDNSKLVVDLISIALLVLIAY